MNQDLNQTNKKDIASPFENKLSHEAVFMNMAKKAEKISTALYMVTDLIDPNDPIRKRIRECGVELIAETRNMSYAFSGDIYFIIARTINKAWELVSLIEVSSSVGFMSDMNARILRNVLVEFISSLRDKQKRESFTKLEDLKIGESLADQISLSKKLFDIDEDIYKRQSIKDTNNEMSFIKTEKKAPDPKPVKIVSSNIITPETLEKTETKTLKPSVSAGERKDKIIEIIRQKGEVMITDLLSSFPEYSSKTIQRELASLVESGILKKEGEKRWSKYSIQ